MRLFIKSQHTIDVVKYNVVKNNLMVKLTIVIYFKVSNIYYSYHKRKIILTVLVLVKSKV